MGSRSCGGTYRCMGERGKGVKKEKFDIKDALIQYCDMREEIKDLRKRIDKLQKDIDRLDIVSDNVKGTRKDGTTGSITISGFPYPEYDRKKLLLRMRKNKLELMEEELLELTNTVDDYINGITKSEVRSMFRFYYLDNLTWERVSLRMNNMYPKREIAYTGDNCRKRHDRFLEKTENNL